MNACIYGCMVVYMYVCMYVCMYVLYECMNVGMMYVCPCGCHDSML
jgi:hypothetical protein